MKTFIEARNRMLIDMDLEAARKMVVPPGQVMSDEAIIAGIHKARLHVPTLPRALRQESLDWLRANGFSDIGGIPLPDRLPE